MAATRYGKARPSGQPSDSTERKIRILLELVRNRFIVLQRLIEEYHTSERSLLRDLQELRKIGARAGFRLSEKSDHGRVRLEWFDQRPTAIDKAGRALRTLIHDAGHAFGEPVQTQLAALTEGDPPAERRFLHFLQPKLREGTRVADVFEALRGAWENNARVAFRYAGKERRVEPVCVLVRSGRYYLLGHEPSLHEWKYYALDNIEPPVKRAGSFTPQAVPPQYAHDDALGFIHGKGEHRVSVRLSKALALSATSREWQRAQEVTLHGDGSATMTFTVSDIGEVVRWAFGFGAEAKIVAPQEAVRMARDMTAAIAKEYGNENSV